MVPQGERRQTASEALPFHADPLDISRDEARQPVGLRLVVLVLGDGAGRGRHAFFVVRHRGCPCDLAGGPVTSCSRARAPSSSRRMAGSADRTGVNVPTPGGPAVRGAPAPGARLSGSMPAECSDDRAEIHQVDRVERLVTRLIEVRDASQVDRADAVETRIDRPDQRTRQDAVLPHARLAPASEKPTRGVCRMRVAAASEAKHAHQDMILVEQKGFVSRHACVLPGGLDGKRIPSKSRCAKAPVRNPASTTWVNLVASRLRYGRFASMTAHPWSADLAWDVAKGRRPEQRSLRWRRVRY